MNRLALAIALARSVPKQQETTQGSSSLSVVPNNVPAWHPPHVQLSNEISPTRRIQLLVADTYQVELAPLLGPQRRRKLTVPRQVAMYLAAELTGNSLSQVGRMFNRDHTTVIHAIRKIEAMRRADLKFDFFISKLMEDLRDCNSNREQNHV